MSCHWLTFSIVISSCWYRNNEHKKGSYPLLPRDHCFIKTAFYLYQVSFKSYAPIKQIIYPLLWLSFNSLAYTERKLDLRTFNSVCKDIENFRKCRFSVDNCEAPLMRLGHQPISSSSITWQSFAFRISPAFSFAALCHFLQNCMCAQECCGAPAARSTHPLSNSLDEICCNA